MPIELEKAQFLYKLARGKKNWGDCYDRIEHFKRFPNLKEILKNFSKSGWLIIHKKTDYTAVSLNTEYKKEIVEFIEKYMPYIKGTIE